MQRRRQCIYMIVCMLLVSLGQLHGQSLKVGTFVVDVSPPPRAPVAYAPTRSILDPLTARGIVLLSDQQPIVLCSVDWLGIANEGLQAWREALAAAAGTTVDRVSVHAVHQHDGMRCDFTTEKVLAEYGMGGERYDMPFLLQTIAKVAKEVGRAKRKAKGVTHIGFGKAKVEKVASNRRILGPADTVEIIRWSRTTDSAAIAAPEGLVDPYLKCLSFWKKNRPLVAMTYYATHPQSYYGQGDVTSEFVGLARRSREEALGIPHIHFNGAGGNITAGKYNDGSTANRPVLARRMARGMAAAWAQTEKKAVTPSDLEWRTEDVALPLGQHLIEKELRAMLAYPGLIPNKKFVAAKHLAWLLRCKDRHPITLSTLRLGDVHLLHLPGELFIEYQLAAQQMLPGGELCTAAYGEYGPGYIGTKIAYSQGGYETSERASRVSPEVEDVLMDAIRRILR